MCETSVNGYLARGGILVKNYHRSVLWVVLACLFALDIITTTVNLNLGYEERNPFMVPFADDPLLHGIVKTGAFVLLFIVIEKAVSFIQEQYPETKPFPVKWSYRTLYGMIIFALLYLIWLYSYVLVYNIRVIS
jgi:hypothetical protein